VNPASEPAGGGLARVLPQRLLDETLTLSNEVEKIDFSHIGVLVFVLANLTVYLVAVPLFNAALGRTM
jgi:hypothetical protein